MPSIPAAEDRSRLARNSDYRKLLIQPPSAAAHNNKGVVQSVHAQPLSGFDRAQYRLLRWISPSDPPRMSGNPYENRNKIEVLLGRNSLSDLRGKVVVDFGCGDGEQSIALARTGATRVIGIDIRDNAIQTACERARAEGVADVCRFGKTTNERADAVVSLDSFEHFSDPDQSLAIMYELLKPGGSVFASFGPTWLHPFGGHLFSVFPWAHLLFTERALLRWRSDLRQDGATRFGEVEGGLNQITINQFEKIVSNSSFQLESLDAVPIRRLRLLHCRLTREFTTSVVRCKLTKLAS